jgi:signal transduction histidine kinase
VTVPAAFSFAIASVAALLALVTARISSGPGWRELKPFSIAAALAAVFAVCDATYTLAAPPAIFLWATRISLFVAGLHGASWFFYGAAQDDRPLSRFDRTMISGGFVAAVLSLIPGVFARSEIYARPVPWLGVVYHDAVPTTLGQACYVYYCFALVVLLARYFIKWRRGVRGAAAHWLAMAALVAAAVNDSLAASRVYAGPYLLDVGFLVVIVCVGLTLTSRFVESARSLEVQTERLRATQAELVKRERLAALGELSAVVAHEVRTPVSIMFNALSVLRKKPATPETEALVAIVEEEAQRLKRMIDDLLAFARPQRLHVAPVDVRATIEAAVDAARAASESPCEVEVAVDDGLAPLHCDAHLVREALINLVTNAFQASRRYEPIRVRASAASSRVRIAVTDDGLGVPRELLPRLFTPFFTTRPTGTGLGLAVVRRIAEAHGGEAFVETEPGAGATFVLVLPVVAVVAPSSDARIPTSRLVS